MKRACLTIFVGTLSLLIFGCHADRAAAVNLDSLQKRLRAGEIPNLHSVVVIRHDRVLADWYFEGADEQRGMPLGTVKFGPETLHDVRSVTKSVVSLLVGIAIADHAITSLDSPVLDYFPGYRDLQTPERRKIRLRDLLSMTPGLHWDETTYPYTDIRNGETAMDMAPDRYRYILSQPIDSPPGTHWRYSGGDVALIAAVVARATKTPIDVYAAKVLFSPLGITKLVWLKDRNGIPFAASGLRLLPRDMAKIGLLMLHGGRDPSGRQIVPEAWVHDATSPHATVSKDGSCPTEYGYFWWLGPKCNPPWYGADGNGGQFIYVVPSRDVVVITTAGLYNSEQQTRVEDLLDEILQALR